jgi:group I intron endonuclease
MNIYSIYKITNKINGKVYIGFTSTIIGRWKKHIFDTINKNKKTDSNKILHNAMRKYGIENFEYKVIYQSKDRDYTLNTMEKFFIVEYNSHCVDGKGYNATYGGQGTFGPKTKEHRKKLSLSNQYRGKILPKEIKEKISLKLKGRIFSEQHLKRKSEAQKKKVMVNNIEYDSGRSAALANNVCPSTIVKWLKNGKAQYI